jgi:hypothetical protein
MFLTTKALPRRTVLRGLGATLALPFLDAMTPAMALAAQRGRAPAHRFLAFYVPNGMAMNTRRRPLSSQLGPWIRYWRGKNLRRYIFCPSPSPQPLH